MCHLAEMCTVSCWEKVSLMCSDLSEESHVPLHPVGVILLDLRVKHPNDIIHHLASDLITSVAGTLATCVLVGTLEDLKGSKPVQRDNSLRKHPKKLRQMKKEDKDHSPEEGGSNTEDHRASLVLRVPAVVHVPYDPAVRGHDGACSGGGNTQEEHYLAAQELSYTGAQDLTAISLSIEERIGRSSQKKGTFLPTSQLCLSLTIPLKLI